VWRLPVCDYGDCGSQPVIAVLTARHDRFGALAGMVEHVAQRLGHQPGER
jgi:hypothetical protein